MAVRWANDDEGERNMATFAAWLTAQRNRDDQTGWVAKFWRDLPDTPRLSNPANIEKHLRERGLFEQTEGLPEAWGVMMTEYRQQRIVNAAKDAGVTPEQLSGGVQEPLPGLESPAGGLPVPDPGPVTLELLDHKLTMIMTALGIKGGLRPEHAMIMPAPPLPPLDWQGMWEQAQREMAAGE